MAINIPDLLNLFEQSRAHLQSEVNRIAEPQGEILAIDIPLERSLIQALAAAHSGGVHGLYQRLQQLSLQAVPLRATDEWLEWWCETYEVFRKAALPAAGTVNFTGQAGKQIPPGTALTHGPSGQGYVLEALVTLDEFGNGSGDVLANEAGAASNQVAGATLTLDTTPDGVTGQAAVADSGLTGGAEVDK